MAQPTIKSPHDIANEVIDELHNKGEWGKISMVSFAIECMNRYSSQFHIYPISFEDKLFQRYQQGYAEGFKQGQVPF